jgi:hypothetical protein
MTRGQNSEVFSSETYGSVTSYNDVSDDDLNLPDQVFLYWEPVDVLVTLFVTALCCEQR